MEERTGAGPARGRKCHPDGSRNSAGSQQGSEPSQKQLFLKNHRCLQTSAARENVPVSTPS